MKPRTKEEIKVMGWSAKLPPITEAQKNWSIKAEIGHYAYVLKKELCCFTCGHRWPNNENVNIDNRSCICPSCGNKLTMPTRDYYSYVGGKQQKIKVQDRSWSRFVDGYTTIATTFNGYQVFRHLYVSCNMRRHEAREVTIREVIQDWISPKGKHTIVAQAFFAGMFGSAYSWYWSGMEIRKSHYKYDCNGDVYPRQRYIPEFKHFRDIEANMSLSKKMLVLSDYRIESMYRTGYSRLAGHFINGNITINDKKLKDYWPAIKICQRNNYPLDKRTYLWMDYVKELLEDGKDIHNAHYVCPVDLKAAHQVYINRRQRAIEHQAEMELLERIDEYNESYYKHVERFKDIIIKKDDLVITPLPDVYAFYVEGKALHHCVFTNKYFNNRHDLILSARIGDTHLETIQVNLDNVEIQQCHGLCNEDSEYHQLIVETVKNHLSIIRNANKNRLLRQPA